MHGIDLNQLNRFVPQIMKQRLSIWSGRFKANHNILKILLPLKLNNLCPKLLEALSEIVSTKRLNILTVWGSKVTVMDLFPDIQGHHERFFVDSSDFLSFTFHGYAPLLIFVNQLAIGLNQNEYSLLAFLICPQGFLQYSKLQRAKRGIDLIQKGMPPDSLEDCRKRNIFLRTTLKQVGSA
jgi:hypothetical protein